MQKLKTCFCFATLGICFTVVLTKCLDRNMLELVEFTAWEHDEQNHEIIKHS